jgi:hypothetical protein
VWLFFDISRIKLDEKCGKNWVFKKIHTIMEKYSFDVGFMHICCKQYCFAEHTHE